MKKKVLDNISYVIALATLLCIVIFKDDAVRMLFIGSIGAFLYGLCSLFTKNKYGIPLFSGGITLFTTMILYNSKILDRFESITFFICSTLALLFIVSFICKVLRDKAIRKKYDLVVEAEVVDLLRNPNTKKEFYQPVFGYKVNDDYYEVGYPGFMEKRIPSIGDKRKILVSSKDNADVYFELDLINTLYFWGLGLLFIIVCTIIIVTLFI